MISIMSFFLSPLHSTETFWSRVLHFTPWKLSLPHFQNFFFITCNSSLLLTYVLRIGQLWSLKPIYTLYPKSQNTLLVTNRQKPQGKPVQMFSYCYEFLASCICALFLTLSPSKKLKLSKETCFYLCKLLKQSTTTLKAIRQKFTIILRKISPSSNM